MQPSNLTRLVQLCRHRLTAALQQQGSLWLAGLDLGRLPRKLLGKLGGWKAQDPKMA